MIVSANVFFFSSRRRHTRYWRDWSSDVCSSDLAALLPYANEFTRSTQPVSELFVATNCGGSDGNSGVTANPAVGWMTDEIVRHGGSSVLAETTETYGAEHILTKRAVSREVGEKLVALMR